ncbi:protein-disulfide reductase DsbD family protein [Azospirillum brasilense]|uniref:Copper resistance protein n=2 Tax=Azospirillum TaxID=191 RepID=A0A6L3B223_AZOBR|nr:protein-disulfide reductase DsbD domain-containing protein [Azospirillum brasilense]KAA0686119.1 copper resistance protein [Azospirillum brasilense]
MRARTFGRLVAAILAAATWNGAAAQAAIGGWATHETVQARVVASVEAVGDRDTVPAGLHLRLANGWKTYWRSPGDAGAPPAVDWSASGNVAGVDVRWPAPRRFTLFGIETFGYEGEVVLPLDVRVERPGEPVALRGRADILVCSTICIPTNLDVSLDLPAGAAAADPETANLIARFEAQVPDDGSRSGLSVGSASVEPGAPGILTVRIASARPLADPDVLVESGSWTFGKPEFSFAVDGREATARLPVVSGPDVVTMPDKTITVTLTDGTRAAEARLAVAAGRSGSGPWPGELLPVLGVAVLGGLVLNLMPCVLPVLSLKLVSVVHHRGRERGRVRLSFLATAVGIAASMLLLAGALVGLKAAGAAVGWGVQFQQPVFLVLMASVLVAFAVSLAGGFDIPLPSRIATALGGAGGNGLAGNFAMGAFATLLATPCSAPFVGTAVGFALARGPAEILAIFAALGVGLASPYLLVAAFPGLTGLLPRPGRWMGVLRRVLALALLGTTAWLLTVLAVQTSWQAALAVAAALSLLAAAMVLRTRVGGMAAAALVVASVSGALTAPAVFGETRVASAAATAWVPFEQAEIGRLVAQGKTVFVDVTAEWCITCQANKSLVIDRGEVAVALAGSDIVPMRADWTRPDRRISDFLARYDRYGIPFNAVYGPGAPNGLVLPEILTSEAVLAALRTARGSPKTADTASTGRDGPTDTVGPAPAPPSRT